MAMRDRGGQSHDRDITAFRSGTIKDKSRKKVYRTNETINACKREAEQILDAKRAEQAIEEKRVKDLALAESIVTKSESGKELSKRDQTFVESLAGKMLVRQACERRGLNPDTFAEMIDVSATVGRGEGLRENPKTGELEIIPVHDQVSQKAREHVTKELGKVYELEQKEQDSGKQEIRLVFSDAFNPEDGTTTRTVAVAICTTPETT